MAIKTESINISVFAALKVSEMSRVPVLLMSNPGLGKSTTVEMFAKVRGYDLRLLRGNSTTESEVLGYDVADTSEGAKSTIRLRPSWFTKILERDAAGGRTLLFLDEITTANDYVQAALLHLIFERMVGDERLPESTLIVSAGNYAQNLSNQMNLLPPLMNRFMLFNIVPIIDDLDTFLCKYSGSIMDQEGQPVNYMGELEKTMRELDAQESHFDEASTNRIGEYFETAIKKQTKILISKEKTVDLTVTDLQNIYSDAANDTKLCGFISFRTLNYLREVALAQYICFGKAGIASDNFRNMIDGLVGLGISRERNNSGDVKITPVSDGYHAHLIQITNEIEKMKNDRLPMYENFFKNLIQGKKAVSDSDIIHITNKITEMCRDKEIESIDRPLSEPILMSLLGSIGKTIRDRTKNSTRFSEAANDGNVSTEGLIEQVTHWNSVVDMITAVQDLVRDDTKKYEESSKKELQKLCATANGYGFRVMSLRKIKIDNDPSMGNIIPEPRELRD